MKKLLFILFLLIPFLAQAQETQLARMNPYIAGSGTLTGTGVAEATCTGVNPSDCYKRETFEGTNACYGGVGNYCDIAWGYMNFDPHVATGALQGTYSAGGSTGNVIGSLALTAADEYWATVIFNAPANSNYVFHLKFLTGAVTLCYATNYGADVFGLNAGGTNVPVVIANFAGSTKYYLKIHAVKGTGANALFEIWITTDPANWGTKQVSNNGTWTTQIDGLEWKFLPADGLMDDVRVHTGDISY